MAGSFPAQSLHLRRGSKEMFTLEIPGSVLPSTLPVNTMFWCTFLDLEGGATFKEKKKYRDAKFKELNTQIHYF